MAEKQSHKGFLSRFKRSQTSSPSHSSLSQVQHSPAPSLNPALPSAANSHVSTKPFASKLEPMTAPDDTASVEDYGDEGSFSQENYKYPILKSDSTLREIGDRMRAIHHEVQSIEEAKLKEYTKVTLPEIRNSIKSLQKEIEMLKTRALREKDEGPAHLETLSAEITKNESKIIDLQSRMHFPFANFVMGSDGLYGSCSDLWVENISGRLEINVIHSSSAFSASAFPSTSSPPTPSPSKLSLRFYGPNGSQDGGLTIKLKVTDFKLKSEVSTIPSVSFQELKWDVVVRISAVLTYVLKRYERTSRMGHWVCPSSDFELEVVTITAPISLDSRLVSALLKPQIMKIVLSMLPKELGDVLTPVGGTPTECSLQGNFSLIGTKMDLMARKMVFSRDVCRLVSCSPTQLAVFRFMQKSVNTPSRIKTLDDLITYILKYRGCDRWGELIELWQQAIDIYTAKLTTLPSAGAASSSASGSSSSSSMSHPIPSPMSFQNLLNGAEVLLRKPVQLCIQLSQIHCQVSLRKLLAAYFSWKDHRVEKTAQQLVKRGLMKSSSSEEYCSASHIRRRREHHERAALLTIFATFLSTLSTDTAFRLHTGDDIALSFERISATLPVVHLANFPVNPFSTTLPLFVNALLKRFQPTETEAVIVSMADEETLEVKVVSSLQATEAGAEGEEEGVVKEGGEDGTKTGGAGGTGIGASPLRAVGNKIKSLAEASSSKASALLHSPHSRRSSSSSASPSPLDSPSAASVSSRDPHTGSGNRLARRRSSSTGEFQQRTEGPNTAVPRELLHLVISGMTSGLALSNEWGRTADSGTIRPGQTIFSVQIDESFRPNQLTLDNHVTAAYRMIAQCSTRPLISEFVRKLPELKNGASIDTLRTTVGGWPVCMKVNEHFRVGVDIRQLSCALNLLATLDCLEGYVQNPTAIASVREISEETLLNLRTSLKTLDKHLSREGVDVDTQLSYHFETIAIQSPALRKRFGGVEEDIILTLSSTASAASGSGSAAASSPPQAQAISAEEASKRGRRRSLTASQPLQLEGEHVLNLRLDLDIWDVVEDMMAISKLVQAAAT